MRYLVLCLLALVSVHALLQDGHDRTFAPEVPSIYLRNVNVANISFVSSFKEPHHFKNLEALALDYANQLIAPATYVVKDSYQTHRNGISHTYLRQTANDLEILNGDLNINIWDRKVLSVGHSFYMKEHVPHPIPEFSSLTALHKLAKFLGTEFELDVLSIAEHSKTKDFKHTITGYPSAVSDVKTKLAYLQVDDGKRLELVWDYEVDVYDHWWNAYVSAVTGEVLALFDWVDADSYSVYPINTNDPIDGPREDVIDPAASNASPLGWHDQSQSRVFTDTRGNNVFAQENWSGGSNWQTNYRPNGGIDLNFDYSINFDQEPDYYIDAATTNLFYWNNIIHDLFYQYGFDEQSGNFQEFNFDRGGYGNDAVQANAQDGSGYNNANFATPPDGSRPRMRMYVWTRSNPMRDGDLDNGIIIHEYGHGISNRLTGGPSNVNCLPAGEPGGMGEGWGDWWATAFRQRSTYTRDDVFPMALYSNLAGIRKFPYTTDMSINPETYSYITRAGYEGVHAKGEVWCGILWEAYWNVVDEHTFQPNWYLNNGPRPGGNIQILQDVVDGLKLQPCRPTFVDARDAILEADRVNWEGRNVCLLWKAFAKRGLGEGAMSGGRESFTVPSNCL